MQGGRGFREILGLMEGLQSPVSPSASLIKQGLYFIFKLHTEGKALWMFNIFIHSSITFAAKDKKAIPIYCIIKNNEVPGNNLQWKIYTLQPENYETLVMEGEEDPSRWKDIRIHHLEDFTLLA